jgi:hypothetical protein
MLWSLQVQLKYILIILSHWKLVKLVLSLDFGRYALSCNSVYS